MRKQPGIMAPPSPDHDEEPRRGLMSPSAAAPPPELTLSALLWSVAVVLAAVELGTQLAL
jgi:hypothetical protein